MDTSKSDRAILVYDGDCPFCSLCVRMLRLRESISLELVDARSNTSHVRSIVEAGYDLDEGMVLVFSDRCYHAHDCLRMLALLSTPSTFVNRVMAFLFRSKTVAKYLYPMLRFCRNLVIRILGRKPLNLTP